MGSGERRWRYSWQHGAVRGWGKSCGTEMGGEEGRGLLIPNGLFFFFFIHSLFKCTQREQCSKPPYTNHSDSTDSFRCCCICSVAPFFLFLSFCLLRLLRESVNIIIFSYVLKIHICKKYAHFWYYHRSLLVNNKIDSCFLSLCHSPLIKFLQSSESVFLRFK